VENKKCKVGMVLEGGSMRGMYTAGVLDVFLDENIEVDGIIGVSAGALFGPNYYSKQRGRVIRYNKRFCKDRRYMSFWNLLLTGNIVGKKFAYYDVTTKYDIFDNETFMKNNRGYYAAATNVETGEAEYLEMKDVLKDMEMLRATSALPFFSEMIKIDGHKYLDGGIADSIPVEKCKEMGFDKIVVVLTRPLHFRKKPMSDKMIKLLELRYKKYPKFVKRMKNRSAEYNQTVEKIIEMEKRGEIFVVRPSGDINLKVIERNPDNLQAVYEMGLNDAHHIIEDLKDYLEK